MRVATLSLAPPPALWNGLGIGASSLCIAHCLLTPLLLVALPAAGLAVLEDEAVHRTLVLSVAAIGAVAFGAGYARHGKGALLALPALGLALLAVAAFGGEETIGESGETLLTMLGGAVMVGSHWLNQSFCRACARCCDEPQCGAATPERVWS